MRYEIELFDRDQWVNFFETCRDKTDEDFLLLMNFLSLAAGESSLENRKKILEDLLSVDDEKKKYSPELKKNIENIFKVKTSQAGHEQIENFLRIDFTQSMLIESHRRAERFFEQKEALKKLEGNTLLHSLGELASALSVNNRVWAEQILKKLIHFDRYRYLLDIHSNMFKSKEQQDLFLERVLEILERAQERMRDQVYVQMLAHQLSSYIEDERIGEFKSKLEMDWSLSRMRALMNNKKYGQEFVGFWFNHLAGRTTNTEIFSFLRSMIDSESLDRVSYYDYWLFLSYFPSDEGLRAQINAKLLNLLEEKGSDPYVEYLLIHLSSREQFKELLSKKDKRFALAEFQMLRNFYLKLLEQGRSVDYSIFQLIKMGDEQEQYLWWVAI